jgi:ectoine hydroxylase-related dioxygenase (phytanoyl-CoA dioxygenase family)
MIKQPSLKFVDENYDKKTVRGILKQFQTDGYAVLPEVFVRGSVDAFVEELQSVVYFNGLEHRIPDDSLLHVWAAQAPRVRQILTPALTHTSAAALPSLCNTMWLISTQDLTDQVPGWHKDREPEGMPGKEYHYPIDVFAGFYFDDVTDEKGPLKIIPGSHWDSSITPHTGHRHISVYCRKEDGLILDQRTWHSGTSRTVPGMRFLVVYAYYLVPVHYGTTHIMPSIQRKIWMRQTTRREQAFWGGTFAPPKGD